MILNYCIIIPIFYNDFYTVLVFCFVLFLFFFLYVMNWACPVSQISSVLAFIVVVIIIIIIIIFPLART